MRRINDNGIKLVKFFEGYSAMPYRCAAGYLTIGWGHLIRPEEKFDSITPEEGEHLLKMDLLSSECSVARLIAVPLSDNQFAALVSFTFNLGGGALQRSTLRRKLNGGDYQGAAEEFPKWCMAGGRRLRGLYRRRLAERNLFLNETEQNET